MKYFRFWGIVLPNKYILTDDEADELTEDTDPILQYRHREIDVKDFRGMVVKAMHVDTVNGVGRVVDAYYDDDMNLVFVMEIALLDNIATKYGRDRLDGKLMHIELIIKDALSGLSLGQKITFDESYLDDKIAVYKMAHEVSLTSMPRRTGSNILGYEWSEEPYSEEFSYDGNGDENLDHFCITRTTIRDRAKEEEEEKKNQENFDFYEHTYAGHSSTEEIQSTEKNIDTASAGMDQKVALETLAKETKKLKETVALMEKKLAQEKAEKEQMKEVYDTYKQKEREEDLAQRKKTVLDVESAFDRIQELHKQNQELKVASKEEDDLVAGLLKNKDAVMQGIKDVYQPEEEGEQKEITPQQFATAVQNTNAVYAAFSAVSSNNYESTKVARAQLFAQGGNKDAGKSQTASKHSETPKTQGGIKKPITYSGKMFTSYIDNAKKLANKEASIDVTQDE